MITFPINIKVFSSKLIDKKLILPKNSKIRIYDEWNINCTKQKLRRKIGQQEGMVQEVFKKNTFFR